MKENKELLKELPAGLLPAGLFFFPKGKPRFSVWISLAGL
jgi:hypothetical protein